jgi:spore maturation protein B
MFNFVEAAAAWAIPVILLVIPLFGYLRRISVYEVFVEGAAEGFQTAIRIMPFLIAMMVAINVFKASGAMDMIAVSLKPFLVLLNVPAELVPLAVMRPLSGTGALGLTTDILHTYGPDSLAGRTASTVLASTDTTLYILTVYFGSVGIKKVRYAVAVGLIGDLVGFLAAVYFCGVVFAA